MTKTFWKKGPIAIAHRGGDRAGKYQKNTLEAFQTAWDLGYRYAETDVILAASGEIVAIHGAQNWLEAGLKREIMCQTLQRMSLSQIRAVLSPDGSLIPTLEEVLTAFPKLNFILDLKTDEIIEPLAKLLKKLKTADRVCITGFNYQRNLRFLDIFGHGQVSVGLTVGRGLRFRNMNMFMLKSGQLKDVEAIFLHHSLVSRPMINLVHHRGFKAIVWTANSSLGVKHAIRSGADGIISDRVALLKQIMDSKK